jgi:site-specific DNA-methyltransferase (adenine-specific)
MEENYDGECEFCHGNTSSKRFLNTHDIVLQDNNAFGILEKVMNNSTKFISQTCYGNKPFGLATNFSDFTDSGIKCIAIKQSEHFVDADVFTDKNAIIGKWKVCMSKATSEGNITPDANGAVGIATNFFIIEPNSICTETYIVVNIFDNKKEAEIFISYMKTKFFRFMLGLRVLTQDINKNKFAWVPDMLDYSTAWTDKELYEHFKLTRQEVAYIESKIKAI